MNKKKKVVGETLVNFILDKSGSMDSVKEATISGFNEYLETLKSDGNKYSFSFVLFDTVITKRYINEPIKNAKKLDAETFAPSGMTALYDAVCMTVQDVQNTVKKNQKVLTVIMTDGEENSSKEYTQDNLKDLIKSMEKTGKWSFVFLGANQDSWANASKMGISKMNTVNFVASSAGVSSAMNTMSANTRSFGAASVTNTASFFSQSDQTNLMNGGSSGTTDANTISTHFSNLGKKSWEKRKKGLLGQ